MSNIIALTKVLIKNNVFSFSGKKKKGKSVSTKGSIIGFSLAMLFCVFCLAIPSMYALDMLLSQYNLSELLITFVIPIGGVTSILFGVFSIISIFYFNKDSEILLPLPIKSSELLISKFLASLVSQYLILAMFIFPLIFGIGIGIDANVIYYLYAIGICVLMPIIPSVIVSILLMLFNKIFNFGKKKDVFMYIITGLIFVFSFAYTFGLEFLLETEDGAILSLVNGEMTQYLKIAKMLFPFFNSGIYCLNNYNEFIGFASFMTFVALNILFMVILYFVGEKLYIKGITNTRGNSVSKKKDVSSGYKMSKGGIMKQLIKKEWTTIKRTPVFMLNVVVSNLIFPIIFVISFIAGLSSGGKEVFEMVSLNIDFNNGSVLLFVSGVLLLLSSICGASSSAISREGKSAKFMKLIPVSLKKQIDAKVYFSMIIELIILFLIEAVLLIAISVPWYFVVMLNVICILVLLINNYLSLLLDLRKPRIDWNEENEAVKQNFNVFWGMMISMALSMILILVGSGIYSGNVNIFLIFAITSVILLSIYVIIVYLINKYQDKLFNKVV